LKIIISIFESVKNDCFLGGFSNFNIAEQANIFYKLRKLLAFTEAASLKSVGKLRNVLAFTEGAVEKALGSSEKG